MPPEQGSRKRKQSSTDSLVEAPRPSKAIKKEVKRFSWELGPEDGPPLAGGVDFGALVGDRLEALTGFLDFAPSPNGQ